MEFIGVTLVCKTIQVSSVQRNKTSSAHCIECDAMFPRNQLLITGEESIYSVEKAKTKISKCNYIKLKILWHSRRNHQQHKKATNQMEEDICKQGL